MHAERIVALLTEDKRCACVALRKNTPLVTKDKPQAGLHLVDLPHVLQYEIFNAANFSQVLTVTVKETNEKRERLVEVFRFVEDLLALRLVNVLLARRFKPTTMMHAARRAIHMTRNLQHGKLHGINVIAAIAVLQTMNCLDTQGHMAYAHLRTYRINAAIAAMGNTKDKIQFVTDLNEIAGRNAFAVG